MTSPALPQHCPSPRELDDLELLSRGIWDEPRFEQAGGAVTLSVPAEVAAAAIAAGGVELVDPEGVPLARVTVETTYIDGDRIGLAGPVSSLHPTEFGAFRSLYLSPSQAKEGLPPTSVTVPVAGPLTLSDLELIGEAAGGNPVLLLALAGHGTPGYDGRPLTAPGLIRATLAAATLLPDARVVAVPVPSRGEAPGDAERDHELGQRVAAAYAPGDVIGVAGVGDLHHVVAEIVDQELPGPEDQGLVLFFTGLSGSGKSTLARALHDVILERGERTVTSLDGDVVRRNLSAGLTFSKEDRETNIRRIGWVAAEISRHHGVAICSPIAPFDSTRQQVREYVDQAGGAFFLIHVSTPVEECERRDRKGLYAKARRGEIPEFTGISSPYEEPEDADVVVDTTGRSIPDALADILAALDEAGFLPTQPE